MNSHHLTSSPWSWKQLLWLLPAYFVIHYAFFNTFFWGFLTTYDKVAGFLPDSWGSLREWMRMKPFDSPVLLLNSLCHPVFLLGAIVLSWPMFRRYSKYRWSSIPNGQWVKAFTFVPAFLLTWELVTYDYNFYLDQAFVFDRLLMIVLIVFILRHPAFIPVFLVQALLYRSQFNYPIGGFPFYDKRVLFDLLILVYAFLLLQRWKGISIQSYWLMVIGLVGGNYFTTGLAKLLVSPHGTEWLLENRLSWLFQNATTRGWMNVLDEAQVQSVSSFLEMMSIPFQLIVLVLELGALFLLLRRRWSMVLLASLIGMHIVIFLTGSMLFWKWMAIDMLLIFWWWKGPKQLYESLLTRPIRIASIILIFGSVLWFKTYRIGWHDTPYNQLYTYVVECEDGQTYEFPKNNFNPYHQLFQFDFFKYLNEEPVLPITGFGYSFKYKAAHQIRNGAWADIEPLALEIGRIKHDPPKKEAYRGFLKQFFTGYNQRLGQKTIFTYFSAPHHIYNAPKALSYGGQSKIKAVNVFFDQYFSAEGIPRLKQRRLLMRVDI